VIIHQKPAILTKQAIVLVNVEFGGYNGADPRGRLFFEISLIGYTKGRPTADF
jgi:hypothetical protein